MADYTLSVKIDGDASGLEQAAQQGQNAIQRIWWKLGLWGPWGK